jgi:hypothetical protein
MYRVIRDSSVEHLRFTLNIINLPRQCPQHAAGLQQAQADSKNPGGGPNPTIKVGQLRVSKSLLVVTAGFSLLEDSNDLFFCESFSLHVSFLLLN